jgi:hypothetical protein
MSTRTRSLSVVGAAAVVAVIAFACHGIRTTEVDTDWLRIEHEEPRMIFPHALGIGDKASRVLVKKDGRWHLVREVLGADEPVVYGAGFALVPVVDETIGPYLLAVRADGATADLPLCPSLTADAGGTTASCLRCTPPCDTIEIATYRDPLAPPAVRSLERPADACPGGVAALGHLGNVEWSRPEPGGEPGIHLQCRAPTSCVTLRADGGALVATGHRGEPCP